MKTRQVIGLHAVREVFKVRPKAVSSIYITAQAKGDKEIRGWFESLKRQGVRAVEKPKEFFIKLGSGHQGVCVEVQEAPQLDFIRLGQLNKCVLVALDEIEDPHNLGAIMRSAWLLGANGIIVPELRSAPLSPVAHKVASGAAEHIPVHRVGNLANTLKDLKEQGFWVYGLMAEKSHELYKIKLNEKVCWVIGSEGGGLRGPVAKVCDEMVSIPQIDSSASLNASVAAGIALAESQRQLHLT